MKALLKLKEDYAAAGGVVEAPKVLLATGSPTLSRADGPITPSGQEEKEERRGWTISGRRRGTLPPLYAHMTQVLPRVTGRGKEEGKGEGEGGQEGRS